MLHTVLDKPKNAYPVKTSLVIMATDFHPF